MVRVEVLGGLRVFDERGEVGAISTQPKRAALLTYLAVERDAKRDKICDLLWPDSNTTGARHTLSQTLLELRKDLGTTWVELRGERLIATPDLTVDIDELEQVIEQGDSTEAVELYRGPFLDGVQLAGGVELERWIEDKRSEVHRKVRDAFRAATTLTSVPELRVGYARAWAALDPLDDDAQHALIEALAGCGERNEALHQYQRYEALVREELEVEPLDQTKQLVEQIKKGRMPRPAKPAPQSHSAPHHAASATHQGAVGPARTPLVGRDRERGQLLERLASLAKGRGSLVLLGGEPGIGKTRLIEFLLEEARSRGYMCVVGHAYEVEGTPPFAPFLEHLEYTARVVPAETFRAVLGDAAPEIARIMPALRHQFDDIGPAIELPPDQARHYLFHRYGDFIARASGVAPLVVFFDDLHWADESSLLLLEHLARQLHEMPLLALGAYRDSELNAARPLAASLERLLRQHSLYRMSLKPLSKREVGELIGLLGGSSPPDALVETISRGTEGNPFFVHEMFRHLNEEGRLFDDRRQWRTDVGPAELEVPAGVRLVLGRRLQRTSADCQSLLAAASVIGSRFTLPLLQAVSDLSEDRLLDALEEAVAAQLVEPIGKREPLYAFTHELIRQTLLDSVSVPRRQRQHLRIAAALEAESGGRIEQRATDMALHLYQAGATADSAKTIRFLRLAGDQALERSGYHEALAQYDRALSMDAVPEDLLPVLMEAKMRALDGMGRWADVIDVGKRAMRMFEATKDLEGLGRVARLVCYRLDWRARYREAVDVGRPALEALADAPGPHRARLRCQVGLALDLLSEPGARELIELGIAEAKELGEKGALLSGELALAIWHYHQGQFAKAVAICEEGSKLLLDSPDQTTRGDFLWIQALTVPLLGRLDRTEEVVREARAVGRERNEVGAELCAAFGEIARTAMTTGDGRRVEALGKELAEGFPTAGGWARAGTLWAGIGRLWQGDAAGAAELMGLDSPDAREPRLWSSLSRAWRFKTAAYARRPDAAALYERVELSLFRAGRRAFPGDAFGLHAAIEGLVVLGDLETAASLYDDAAASLDLQIVGHIDGLWQCTAGLAAACAEDWEASQDHFEKALTLARDIPHVMAENDTRRWFAWMLLRRRGPGDRVHATKLLHEAISGYESLGASLFQRLAEEMRAGARS